MSRRKRLMDAANGAHLEWRDACRLANNAYRAWVGAAEVEAQVAYTRYTAALDAEELAADLYAAVVRRVRSLVASSQDLEPSQPY